MAVMRKKVTIKEVIFVIKLSQFPILCWPMPHDTTKFKLMCVKLYHCLCIIISIALQLPLIYGIQKHFDDPPILVNQIVLLSSITHSIFNFIFHMVNYRHVQNVTYEMLQFCNAMKPREEVIIQRYVDKCLMFHSFSMGNIVFVTFATAAIIPFVTHQTFPVMAEYPFDVYYQPLKTIIYIQHTVAGTMIGAQVCTNIFMALLLWFTSARFEILIEEMREATNVYQLYECIKKHQHLLNYAREVTIVARPFALTTVICSTVSLIVSFLLFISKQPLPLKVQFLGIAFIGTTEVFMYSWPAEHLIHMTHEVAQAAFYILEDNRIMEMWKCLQIIIMRSQKPVTISIPIFLPEVSLSYFSSYLSTVLSYFTTLRVMME